jgi:hypothetical protein
MLQRYVQTADLDKLYGSRSRLRRSHSRLDNPLGYEKDVISDLSLSNDNVVAAETMDLVEARKECVSKPGRRQVLRKNLLKYLQCQKS